MQKEMNDNPRENIERCNHKETPKDFAKNIPKP
jgi:hypothetical protein